MNETKNDENQKNIDDLLLEALNSELKTKNFYEEASAKAQSKAGKSLFKDLSEFEQNHYLKVKKIIESRKNGISLETPDSVQKLSSVRSEVDGEFEANKDEIVDVIHLAIEGEKKAQDRYKKIADEIDDSTGKNIFSNLALDERNHQKILEDQFYHISNKGTILWE